MVFDVESIGLHGEAFAVAAVIVDDSGHERDSFRFSCPRTRASGTADAHAWVAVHIPEMEANCGCPVEVRREFWGRWEAWSRAGAVMVADCGWPVEARFLAACIDDDPGNRDFLGPYPLHDVATARMMAGFDPLATVDRLSSELPVHDPMADARQSARLWIEALRAPGRAPSPIEGL